LNQISVPSTTAARPARQLILLAVLLALTPLSLVAQNGPPPVDGDSIEGASLRVFLMTMGQGNYIFERFGHNAIWIRDERTGQDIAWNYGVFAFDDPGYIGRLVRGNMQYWVEAWDANRMAQSYAADNRTVVVQELNLTPARRAGLRDFLIWNAREENRFYRYDYYRDNCSTRVRDAIDRALDGQLRLALDAMITDETYRGHTQRLLADRLPAATGTLLALGPATDVPLSAWEAGFLPVQLMQHVRMLRVSAPDGTLSPLVAGEAVLFEATRAPEAAQAPDRLPLYLGGGLGLGLLNLLLGYAGARARGAAIAFHIVGAVVMLAVGLFGTVILGLWAFTDHEVTYRNENLFQANPLALVAGVLLIVAAFGPARRATRRLVLLGAGLAAFGFAGQALPALDQVNGGIIALLLPVHLGIAGGLLLMARRSSAPKDTVGRKKA
jgi:hypothetical protein